MQMPPLRVTYSSYLCRIVQLLLSVGRETLLHGQKNPEQRPSAEQLRALLQSGRASSSVESVFPGTSVFSAGRRYSIRSSVDDPSFSFNNCIYVARVYCRECELVLTKRPLE